jgi:HlyD family secretion protein
MFARGEFDLGAQPALTVPQRRWWCAKASATCSASIPTTASAQVKVQIGRIAGDRLQVLSGLAADARIVASGGGFLNDGDLVRVAGPRRAPRPPRARLRRPSARTRP